MRVENVARRPSAPAQPIHDLVQQAGFTGARLAGQNQESLASLDSEQQLHQGSFVPRCRIIEPRIRRNVERILAQSQEMEESIVHAYFIVLTNPRPNFPLHLSLGKGISKRQSERDSK